MKINTKDRMLVEEQLKLIIEKNNGQLPRGSVQQVADKLGFTYAKVWGFVRKSDRNSARNGHVRSNGTISESFIYGEMQKDDEKDIKFYLARLEGAVSGLSAFHPKLASFMLSQVNALYRILLSSQRLEEDNANSFSELSGRSKPEWKDIDREALRNTNNIQDNLMIKDIDADM